MKDLNDQLGSLSLEARTILEHKLQEKHRSRLMPTIPLRSSTDNYPLSFAQQRLWFFEQWQSESPLYNISKAVYLKGSLDIVALEGSLGEIVRRHDVLRSTFSSENGHPLQHIAFPQPVHLRRVDLTVLPLSEREAEAAHLAVEESCCPFDLAIGPLFRASLLILGETEHHLLLTMHHIVSDGWSMGVFVREIGDLYNAFVNNKPSPLPELPIQYADYAQWQREWLEGDVLEKQLDYWKKQLAGAPPVLALPTDHPRSAIQTDQGATSTFVLSAELTSRLKDLSQREGVTLFMTLLAAFQTLLYRYTSQTDIVVGSPIANRTHVEIEGLIGFFINTLVLRSDLSNNPTFCDLLKRVRTVALGAYAHQDLPFEKLVEELNPTRDLSHAPLFQVMFVFQNTPMPNPVFTNLDVKVAPIFNGTAHFDLLLDMVESSGCLKGTVEYAVGLFDEQSILCLINHFQLLLESISIDPNKHILNLSILSGVEVRQLVEGWNQTEQVYPFTQFITQIFETQVSLTPSSIAVLYGGDQLTYQELNCRANNLAKHLIDRGVGPDVLVGLFSERNIDFLVSILAIFKAGGAYLPLDHLSPPKRLSQVISQSNPTLIITTNQYATSLMNILADIPSGNSIQVLQIGTFRESKELKSSLTASWSPQNLAYIMYTSGSTGKPKGVMVEHNGMLNHIYAKIHDLDLASQDIVAQNGPQTFDISIWQCFAPLLVGGQVCLIPDDIAHSPIQLIETIEHYGISILQVVPSMLRAILQQIESLESHHRPKFSALRWMIPTGDALPTELCIKWQKLYPLIPILNTYGSTECSDDQCHYCINWPLSVDYDLPIMPIGSPIANMQVYVLDAIQSPVPLGVTGELYIGGIGIGRGYLDEPVKTAEVFIPDPFSKKPGSRLYKTGDLARFLPEGIVEFIGRRDQLVKVRGFRIELGEIESTLALNPLVKDVVVVTQPSQNGEQRLAAYIVPKNDDDHEKYKDDLRSFLRERLPEYMIPSTYTLLDVLPLNANGKLDRKALPYIDMSDANTKRIVISPRNEFEKALINIWESILSIEQISVTDNFFDLGGHSLLATQVISRIRDEFHTELTVRSIFEAPILADFALRIESALLDIDDDDELKLIVDEVEKLSDEEVKRKLSIQKLG